MASRYSLPISPARSPGTNEKGKNMRVWFITGASRGFGALIAEAALKAGDAVVATARDPNTVTARLGSHERLLATRLDVTSEAEAHEAAGQAVKKFGRIDILVNNAGYGLLGAIEEASAAETTKLFGTNVFGLLGVTRAVLPHMRRQRSGHVINISSVGGYAGFPGWGVYGATKFAVEGISEALAGEVAPLGIKVTVVEPGFFRTDFLDESSLARTAQHIEDYTRQRRQHPRPCRRRQPRPARRSAQAGAAPSSRLRTPRLRRCGCRSAATRWSGSRPRTPLSQRNSPPGARFATSTDLTEEAA